MVRGLPKVPELQKLLCTTILSFSLALRARWLRQQKNRLQIIATKRLMAKVKCNRHDKSTNTYSEVAWFMTGALEMEIQKQQGVTIYIRWIQGLQNSHPHIQDEVFFPIVYVHRTYFLYSLHAQQTQLRFFCQQYTLSAKSTNLSRRLLQLLQVSLMFVEFLGLFALLGFGFTLMIVRWGLTNA